MTMPWRDHLPRWGLVLLVALVTQLTFPSPDVVTIPAWQVGARADRTVVAPVSYVVRKSDEEIAREQTERAQTVPPVYRFDATARDSAVAALKEFLSLVEAAAPSGPAIVARAGDSRLVSLSADEAAWLARSPARRRMSDSLVHFVTAVLSEGVADAGQVRGESSEAVSLMRGDNERVVPRSALITFSDFVERSDRAAVPEADALGQRVFRRIAASFYRPTVVFDQDLTASRRGQRRLGVDSLRYRVIAGEPIVNSGDRVTPEIHDKLVSLRERLRQLGPTDVLSRGFAGGLLADVLLLSPFWLLLMLYRRETYADWREMAFLALLLIATVLLARGVIAAFPERTEFLPLPLAILIIAMLYNGRVAVVAALSMATLLGQQWLLKPTPAMLFGVVAGTAAAMSVRAIRRRSRVYVTVGLLACAYALGSIAAAVQLGWTESQLVESLFAGYVSAVVSVSLAMLLLPFAESATHRTTDLTLLELADPSRPLLRRLAVEAPGTWAHSVTMANLCESACTVIGANGLLARVGCYYHDIGKLSRPQFFVENQSPGTNPHDRLVPEESAAIIRSHVTEGMQLADAARLPDSVAAFIPEHHGTSEIRYFLHRASEGRDPADVDTAAYRYPGPRPRSRETAVVMLADSVEAVVRTLQKPGPESVRAAINEMVGQRIASGQLDDAPLTLRDLDAVREEFARVLTSQFHSRVEYPGPPSETRVFRSSTEVLSRG
ncbi:MAG TPA: HDIG domain-containing protein [Gemmatimonadales bacterium]|nr:HDIG domain-containing protein [Gemmatimonadales bacterium]